MSKRSETTLISYVSGISVIGPGLADWSTSQPILTGNSAYQLQPTIFPIPILLPAAERRRSGDLVKLTLAVGLEAAQNAALDPASLA
jgi:hypothetical protein